MFELFNEEWGRQEVMREDFIEHMPLIDYTVVENETTRAISDRGDPRYDAEVERLYDE